MNEVDKFFDGLHNPNNTDEMFGIKTEVKPDIKTETEVKENPEPKEGDDLEKGEPHKNRRHRRLEMQLEKEREARIRLEEQLKNKPVQSISSDVPAEWIALYGDNPEAEKAWKIQEKMLKEYADKAKTEALNEFKSEQQKLAAEQKKWEEFVNDEFESLEEAHGIDLTSNAPAAKKARKEFLEIVEKLSPKDENGEIINYVDFDSAFELYTKTKVEKPANRAKELASQSAKQSSPVDGKTTTDDATLKWLRQNGIRV